MNINNFNIYGVYEKFKSILVTGGTGFGKTL